MSLHLRGVEKTYGKGDNAFQALKPVNLGINPGSTVAIVGKSGSGKSTLLHLMVGLDHPSSGEILFNGKNILKDYKTDAWRGENVGIIFQQFFLQPKDSVLDNVALPLKLRGMSKRKRSAEAKDALRLVGLLDKAKNKANDLSGGQKQRVAIARAIVTKPAVLVADEPTGNLDSENGEAVERLLFQLNQQLNTTLIIVTHDDDLAARCQRIIRLRDGEVIEDTGKEIAVHGSTQPVSPTSPRTSMQPPVQPAVRPAKLTSVSVAPISAKPLQRPGAIQPKPLRPVRPLPKPVAPSAQAAHPESARPAAYPGGKTKPSPRGPRKVIQ